MALSSKRTGVLVVRVWVEEDPEAPLRARISRSSDLETAVQEVSTAASVEAVCDIVRRWLDAFLAAARDGEP